MANFMHYATPAPEWTQFEKTWKRPQSPPGATVQELRDLANERAAKLFSEVLGRPDDGLDVTDIAIPSTGGFKLPVRLYRPSIGTDREIVPLYISFHGGGYHLGNLETEDPHCRQVALGTGAAVLNVNYRHTPEWTFPTPVEDAWAAFQWVSENGNSLGIDPARIFVGGVSAGAVLAISVALRALDQPHLPEVKGLILGTPSAVHPDYFPIELLKSGCTSLEQNANAPFINLSKLRALIELYRPDPTHPEYSPLLQPQSAFSGLCRTSFHVAGLDPLRDEGLLLEEKLKRAGVETILRVYPGVPHSFMSLPSLPSAQKWRQDMQQDLRTWISSYP